MCWWPCSDTTRKHSVIASTLWQLLGEVVWTVLVSLWLLLILLVWYEKCILSHKMVAYDGTILAVVAEQDTCTGDMRQNDLAASAAL